MLEVSNINTFYAKSHILHNVSIGVKRGEIVGLLGRNGVGKTTTLKSIMGVVAPREGSIRFEGQNITGLRPHQIARLGIGYVPDERRIFPTLSVKENLLMGMKPGKKRIEKEDWSVEKVCQLFPGLKQRISHKGGYLSGGEQQMLTIGRTLMGNPRLLLIDEPTEGLAPKIIEVVVDVIREVHQAGAAILLVEQSIDVVLELSGGIFLMSKGEIVFKGSPEEFQERPDIREKYLEV
jgi:branched-chain amino acid transport system ATP-binding protein